MRKDVHPISGDTYEELGNNRVRVEKATGEYGIFLVDGTHLEGELTSADIHLLRYIGGQDLPAGHDLYWVYAPVGVFNEPGMLEPMDYPLPRQVAAYQPDPGQMTEEGMRSAGHVDIDYLLDNDRHPEKVPEVYRLKSPMPGGPERVDVRCYYDKAYHDLEVEKIWKRTWQMACREDDIPHIGDHHVYEIANLSFLIVRTAANEFKAHYNACLHRGRKLKDCDGRNAKMLRCPYHGWSWNIDGSLKEIPAEWDFPGVRDSVSQLPGARVETWGGFVFINPDPDAQPLEEFLGPVMLAHYEKFKLQNRFKQAHVQKTIRANWKVVMEAFMESYHVIATHPQQIFLTGDMANTPYDVFGNWGRADHILGGINRGSPLRGIFPSQQEALEAYRGSADNARAFLRTLIGDEVDEYSDADLNSEASFNDLFPNLHPWGGFARIVFRFRPNGGNPHECLFDVMLLGPWPEGKPKPAPAPLRVLDADQPWTDAPELFMLAKILDQDVGNVERVQEGLQTMHEPYAWFSAYQEGKIRNFHRNYNKALGITPETEADVIARSR